MIKMININEIENMDNIIIVPSKYEFYYKKMFVNSNKNVTTFRKYFLDLYDGNKKLSNKYVEYIYMYKSFLLVKESLTKYNDFISFNFINELLKTYDEFYEYKLIKNNKTSDLTIIFNKYEELLCDNGYINFKLLKESVIKNYVINEDICLLNLEELDKYEIDLIKKINETNLIYINPVLLENNNLKDILNNEFGLNLNITKKEEREFIFKETNDLEEELTFVLNDISKKVIEGYKYNDFIIVSNDINYYEPYFNYIFDIPYLKNESSGVLTSRFLKYFSKLLNGDFSCLNFINLLKLDLFQIDKDVVDKLDNYIFSYNLEDKSFYEEFIYNPSGNKKHFNEKEKCELEKIENCKNEIIIPIKYLLENIIGQTDIKLILKEFYTYISEEKIDERLNELDPKGLSSLIEMLEVVNDNLDVSLSVKELFELLSNFEIINNNKIINQDSVLVSNISDANFLDKKFIYFIGANNNTIPDSFKLSSLLNSNDINKDNLIEKIKYFENKENFKLNSILSLENVIISYHKLSKDLSLFDKADFIKDIKLKEYDENKIYNIKLLKEEYSKLLGNKKINQLKTDEFNMVNNFSNHNLNYKISKEKVEKLLTNNLKVSPSSIEVYSKCRFYYFCDKALRLKVNEKYLFDNREVGTFVHYILENIIKNEYDKVTLNNLDEMISKYSINYLEDNNKIINNKSLYLIKRLSGNVSKILSNIIKENEISLFRPKYFEFKISDKDVLKPVTVNLDEGTLSIIGTIDRVDTYEDEENLYFRILDYKTGTKKFRLDDLLEGLNLQMLLYMLAFKENKDNLTDKNIVPSGIFYYTSLLKYTKSSRKVDKEESVKERLKMDGIINYNSDVLKVYGNDNFKEFSKVFSKDELNEEKIYNNDTLELLFNKLYEILINTGNLILSGDFKVNPILSSRVDSCSYCKFKSVCKFDYHMDKKRKLIDYSNKEVLKMLEGDNDAKLD